MEIIKKTEREKEVFAVTGKIDTNSAGILEQELIERIESEKEPFAVDLSGVTFVSSAGLRAFLSAQKKANANKVNMIITGVGRQLQEIFDITGFSGILNIE